MLLLILPTSSVQANPKTAELIKAFETEVENVNTRAQPSLSKLGKNYLSALSRLIEQEKKKGNLDETIELKKEVDRWQASGTMPEPLSEIPVVKKAQLIYQDQEKQIIEKKGVLILKSYRQLDEKLAKYEKFLVSSDKVEDAQKVREERDKLKASDLIRQYQEATGTGKELASANKPEPSKPEKPKKPKTKEELQQYLLTTAWRQNDGKTIFRFFEKGVFGEKGSSNRYTITGKDTLDIHWGGSGAIHCEVSRNLREIQELNGARATFHLVEDEEQ